jgi:hypothetical protein
MNMEQRVGFVEPAEYVKAEDYATHTNGLPKTNFEAMRVMAFSMAESDFMPEFNTLQKGGVHVGRYILKTCEELERRMANVDFNSFAYPAPLSNVSSIINCTIMDLATVYLIRSELRKRDMPMDLEYTATQWQAPMPGNELVKALFSSLVSLAQQKDAEYGASWCKRGGIGAWFTTVRKFDRLVTQMKAKNNNIWDVTDDINSTEALEETIKDAINYLLLIKEKRQVIAGV